MHLNDFTLEDQHGYLVVDGTQPGASDRVRRWRAHCRKHRKHSISAMTVDDVFHLEVRWPDWWQANPDYETLSAIPVDKGPSTWSGGGTGVRANNLQLDCLQAMLEQVQYTLESYTCEEMQLALLDRLPSLPPAQVNPIYSSGGQAYSFKDPNYLNPVTIPLRLSTVEYEVVSAALLHLFGASAGPIALYCCAAPMVWGCVAARIEDRANWPDAQLDSLQRHWEKALGAYRWESRFSDGLVELTDNEQSFYVTRPGIDTLAQRAVLWGSGSLDRQHFGGLVYLSYQDSGWNVLEVSYDQDWEGTLLEPPSCYAFLDRSLSIDASWKRIALDFPQTEASLFDLEELPKSNALYDALVLGTADSASLDLPVFSTFQGTTLSTRQILKLCSECPEILWDFEKSQAAEAVTEMGHLVLDMRDASASNWKFLTHLQEHFPVVLVGKKWVVPHEAPYEQRTDAIRALLERTLQRAGCSGLAVRFMNEFSAAFQVKGDSVAGLEIRECLFESSGTVWIHPSHVRGFGTGLFHLLGQLCRWGDPENRWTKRLWRAAAIESARLAPDPDRWPASVLPKSDE